MKHRLLLPIVVGVIAFAGVSRPQLAAAAEPLTLVVMDPLSLPLSCDCVQGYAQRKYELLEAFLTKRLERPVIVVWNESLESAVKETEGAADLVIGKHSVVLHDAKRLHRAMIPIASLTGKDGEVTQRGLIVVRDDDRARKIADLSNYRVFFGPEEAAEKSEAAMRLLKSQGVAIPEEPERYGACSEAAVALLKLPADESACAVISSYAAPLLEGCGSVQKGDLRIVGETAEIPFVTAFVPDSMDADLQRDIEEALALVGTEAELLIGLETLSGFVPWEQKIAGPGTAKKN